MRGDEKRREGVVFVVDEEVEEEREKRGKREEPQFILVPEHASAGYWPSLG